MYKKIFLTTVETVFSVFVVILGLLFIISTFENILIQEEMKNFINSCTFEEQIDNTYFFSLEDEGNSHIEKEKRVLGKSGDIFVMPQSRMEVFPFFSKFVTCLFGGHSGLVYDDRFIIEAMGGTVQDGYVFFNSSDLYSEERTVIGLNVKTTDANKQKAIDYAYSKIDYKYNFLYIFDNFNKYYCTDLCSRSFGKENDLNLNLNKDGLFVSTQDLLLSDNTEISFIKIKDGEKVYIYYKK